MNKQFITDTKGNRIAVILPINEYNKMIENLEKYGIDIVSDQSGVYEKADNLTQEQKDELNNRFEDVLNNPKEGKTWDEVKKNLLSK